ncbi:MAG: hypothetical protein M1820_000604 [Bogoriella megaspora]|nr:MAG: hypothetical protein M1820_000604 [Bogoriella megaspora]
MSDNAASAPESSSNDNSGSGQERSTRRRANAIPEYYWLCDFCYDADNPQKPLVTYCHTCGHTRCGRCHWFIWHRLLPPWVEGKSNPGDAPSGSEGTSNRETSGARQSEDLGNPPESMNAGQIPPGPNVAGPLAEGRDGSSSLHNDPDSFNGKGKEEELDDPIKRDSVAHCQDTDLRRVGSNSFPGRSGQTQSVLDAEIPQYHGLPCTRADSDSETGLVGEQEEVSTVHQGNFDHDTFDNDIPIMAGGMQLEDEEGEETPVNWDERRSPKGGRDRVIR